MQAGIQQQIAEWGFAPCFAIDEHGCVGHVTAHRQVPDDEAELGYRSAHAVAFALDQRAVEIAQDFLVKLKGFGVSAQLLQAVRGVHRGCAGTAQRERSVEFGQSGLPRAALRELDATQVVVLGAPGCGLAGGRRVVRLGVCRRARAARWRSETTTQARAHAATASSAMRAPGFPAANAARSPKRRAGRRKCTSLLGMPGPPPSCSIVRGVAGSNHPARRSQVPARPFGALWWHGCGVRGRQRGHARALRLKLLRPDVADNARFQGALPARGARLQRRFQRPHRQSIRLRYRC